MGTHLVGTHLKLRHVRVEDIMEKGVMCAVMPKSAAEADSYRAPQLLDKAPQIGAFDSKHPLLCFPPETAIS